MDLALTFEYGYRVMYCLLLDKKFSAEILNIWVILAIFFHHAILHVTSLYHAISSVASGEGPRYF